MPWWGERGVDIGLAGGAKVGACDDEVEDGDKRAVSGVGIIGGA